MAYPASHSMPSVLYSPDAHTSAHAARLAVTAPYSLPHTQEWSRVLRRGAQGQWGAAVVALCGARAAVGAVAGACQWFNTGRMLFF